MALFPSLRNTIHYTLYFTFFSLDALKACRALVKSSSARLTVCLPLYKNLIALERAYGRIDSARGICNHLLKLNPSVMELWLCLAALQNAVQMDGSVGKVYEEALDKCDGHAEVAFSAARYYLEQVSCRQKYISRASFRVE